MLPQQGPALLLIILPLAQMSYTSAIFSQDYTDGTLELQLVTTSADNIVITKFVALSVVSFVSLLLIMPLFCIIYGVEFLSSFKLILTYFLMLLYINGFIILTSAIKAYFSSVCSFISTLIFPLIIPGIICGVLSIFEEDTYIFYISLLVGLNFILVPLTLVMSAFLIRNIYNI